MTGCNIIDHPGFAYYASSCSDPSTVLGAEDNWWGVTDSASIEALVYHRDDYATAPVVDFIPFATEWQNCDCTGFCDVSGDGVFSPLDVAFIVKYVYQSLDARPKLYNCPLSNGDWNCSGDVSPLDVAFFVKFIYQSQGTGPCDPCAE